MYKIMLLFLHKPSARGTSLSLPTLSSLLFGILKKKMFSWNILSQYRESTHPLTSEIPWLIKEVQRVTNSTFTRHGVTSYTVDEIRILLQL